MGEEGPSEYFMHMQEGSLSDESGINCRSAEETKPTLSYPSDAIQSVPTEREKAIGTGETVCPDESGIGEEASGTVESDVTIPPSVALYQKAQVRVRQFKAKIEE
ncbi:MAG: hypothetical protein KAV87_18500 [Desulfobacteraceae bacterium]|nr:hypothetical protein [Desulfobacteraceae bacterium]